MESNIETHVISPTVDTPTRILVILTPDVIKRSIVGNVIQHFEAAGLKSIALRQRKCSDYLFKIHCKGVGSSVHECQNLHQGGTSGTCSPHCGDCIFIVYSAPNAIDRVRRCIGSTEIADTILNKYGNVVYASKIAELTEYEIGLWFPELIIYTPSLDDRRLFDISYNGC